MEPTITKKKAVAILVSVTIAYVGLFYAAAQSSYQKGYEDGANSTTCNKPIQCPGCVCPMPNICPPEKTCPQCQECVVPNCPEPTPCPTCPTTAIPADVEKQLLNIRPGENGAPAFSGGCFHCLRKAWEILDLPNRPKFNPAPSMGLVPDFKKTLPDDFYYFQKYSDNQGPYFMLCQYPDPNGRKRFGWNKEDCANSCMRINDL